MGQISEKYEAVVKKNDDPEKRGRIKVACAGLLGGEDETVPHWIEPVYQWGHFAVPDINEIVEIEVTTSDDLDESFDQSSIDNLNPRWSGKRFWGNEEAEEGQGRTPIPGAFTERNYGKRRGFATPGGHVLLFDDTEKDRGISLSWHDGNGNFSLLAFDKDGSFTINTKASHVLYMNAKTGEFSIIDPSGNTIRMKDDTIALITSASNVIEMKGDNISILAQNGIAMSSKNTDIDGTVALGGALALDFALLANVLMAWLTTHTHPTGVGPSGPPIVPPPVAAVSTTVKVAS